MLKVSQHMPRTMVGTLFLEEFLRYEIHLQPAPRPRVGRVWCLGWKTGGGGCCLRSPGPAGVRRGYVRRSSAPTRWVGGAAPRGGRGGLLPCGQGLVGVLPTQSALVLEFLQNPFLQGGRCTYVRGAHPVHKQVRRELGLVLGRSQVIPNDQVGKDFVFLELGRHGREALALIQRGLDLADDRH